MDTRLMKEDNKKQIYNEASIMKKLFHPNVISFKDVFKDVKLDYFYIVMEYANDGDLSKKIKAQKQKTYGEKYFSEEKILQYFYQICRGLQYIHSKNIIHRDIKSQNIFLMKNGKIKIGDFGIAKALTNSKNNASTVIGTPYYFSPEIINGEPYNYKTDIWSLGVVLYEMCCLKLPFESNNIAQLSIKIMKGKYDPIPNKYSRNMANLIKDMLNLDQKLRPSITEVMQSPLIKNYSINKYSNKSYKNIHTNKKYNINSTDSQFNFKINEQILDQRKIERKSAINKIKNKEKSCSPINFKNKSYIGKLNKQNCERFESPFEFPKASNKIKTKKSNIFKRVITQKNFVANLNINKEEFEYDKINKVSNSNNINNNINNDIYKSMNKIIKSTNNIINVRNKEIYNTKSTNNFINKSIDCNENNKNIDINKISNNKNNINNNTFYNNILINKEEIINRSNEFDKNFSGKSILFDKEKTINISDDNKNDDEGNKKQKLINNSSSEEKVDSNKINNDSLYNFNFEEQPIKMFTLKEEDEEETIKSTGTLYNGDFDEINLEEEKNIIKEYISNNNKIQKNNLNNLNEDKTNITKEINNSNEIQKENINNLDKDKKINEIIQPDLNFEIINNSLNEEKKKEKETQFDLEEYIKKEIGEKMYLIIKENWIDFNIEQIVNYSYENFINKLRDILKKNEFREREIKKAEMYLFDIFFNYINQNKF